MRACFANYPGHVKRQVSGSAVNDSLPRAVAEAALLAARARGGKEA